MTSPKGRLTILIKEIARYTVTRWGVKQAERYETTLTDHFDRLGRGEVIVQTFLDDRPELMVTLYEHHYIFYVVRPDIRPPILILAVLRKRMNLVSRMQDWFGVAM